MVDLSTTNTRSQKETDEFISFEIRKLENIENWILMVVLNLERRGLFLSQDYCGVKDMSQIKSIRGRVGVVESTAPLSKEMKSSSDNRFQSAMVEGEASPTIPSLRQSLLSVTPTNCKLPEIL